MGNKKKKRKLTDFGNALKALRIQKNYQQIDVAVAIDKSRQTVGAYEAGVNLPPIDIILQLARDLSRIFFSEVETRFLHPTNTAGRA